MKLIGLLVLLGLVSLVEGEVVKSFASSCPDFFIKAQNNGFFNGFFNFFMNNNNHVTPTVLDDQNYPNRYKQICQKYENKYRYATLYDTHNKIPVYSAYLYTGYEKVDRKPTWMIEPQLDGPKYGRDMTTEAEAGGPVGNHQAVNEDYRGSGYQRGHLYPHCQNCNQDQANSTFTLTNAAPQKQSDNTQWYNQVENIVKRVISEKCSQNSAHVVTGVVPGDTNIGMNGRVNIPSHFWSAFCCTYMNNQNRFTSHGYVFKMTGKRNAQAMTVAQLNQDLGKEYNAAFQVFGSITHCS